MIDWKFIANRVWKTSSFSIPDAFEPPITRFVGRVGGKCFIDVGANVGMYAIRFRHNFSRVYAIEPHPGTRRRLKLNAIVRFARNVEVLDFAASDIDGETRMFLDGSIGRASGSADTIEPNFVYRPASLPNTEIDYSSDNRRKESIVVKKMALDSYPFPSEIDLVKIDVEGAEFKVLDGATKTLGRTFRVIIEVHDRERRAEMQDLLKRKWAFHTRWLDDDHILGSRAN